MNKKILIFCLATLLFSLFLSADNNFVFIIGGNYYTAADSNFKDMFGKKKYFPEGKLAVRLTGNLYIWGSCGYFSTTYRWNAWSNKGVLESDIEGKRTLDKLIISGGLGYYAGFLRKNDISVRLELGACRITNTIETTKNNIVTGEITNIEEEDEEGIGIRGNIGVTYGLYKTIFAEASLGYMYAQDTIDDEKINLGGFKLSLGLGIAF